MLGDKEEHFEGKGTDLAALSAHIQKYLTDQKFTVQTSPESADGTVLQARKAGFFHAAIDADHALSITIKGAPGDFTVHFGVGKWLEHLGIAVAETLVLSELFLPIDVAESLWTLEIENKLIADVRAFVG